MPYSILEEYHSPDNDLFLGYFKVKVNSEIITIHPLLCIGFIPHKCCVYEGDKLVKITNLTDDMAHIFMSLKKRVDEWDHKSALTIDDKDLDVILKSENDFKDAIKKLSYKLPRPSEYNNKFTVPMIDAYSE